jgi:hypothetical protein
MDFMKLLQSLEDLLYEVIVWLVFYPLTLWLSLRYPQRMMDYADTELGDVQSEQYTDTLSPPLFLMLSLAISHGIGLALNVDVPTSKTVQVLDNSEHLLIFRVLAFSLLPLAMSLRLLAGLGVKLDREALRAPFYSQCYITAPFAMAFGLILTFGRVSGPYSPFIELVGLSAALGWYLRQQARWFDSKLKIGLWNGWLSSIGTFMGGVLAMAMVVFAVAALGAKAK